MLFQCGGRNDSGSLSACYALDPATNSWSAFASMNVQRYAGAAALVDAGWWVTG